MLVEYKTVLKEAETTIIEKKSKFIAQVKPVTTQEEAEEFLSLVRKTHYSATHNVPAYIIGKNGEIQKASDDGEPSGTAGMPMLEVLKSLELVDVVVVVTRYFGGTLLGRGGLIRAYGKAAKAGVLAAGVVRMVPHNQVKLTVDYGIMGKVQNELINMGIEIKNVEYFTDVTFEILILPEDCDRVHEVVQNLTADQFSWIIEQQVYVAKHEDVV
ncbi:MAG: YigZ family protein [Firmicutes bacterium]|nr:YigZ family protein [Bacillota bacterium]